MTTQQILDRLSMIEGNMGVAMSDHFGHVTHPCCIRFDGNRIVLDVVSGAIASLEQEGLTGLSSASVRKELEPLCVDCEVVVSDYNGNVSPIQAIRKEADTVVFDVDGVAA